LSVMTRVREEMGGAGFCPREAGIARLMIATAKQNFMRILLPHCSGPVIVLLQALVVKPDGCFRGGCEKKKASLTGRRQVKF
jgi:hypothetical protein